MSRVLRTESGAARTMPSPTAPGALQRREQRSVRWSAREGKERECERERERERPAKCGFCPCFLSVPRSLVFVNSPPSQCQRTGGQRCFLRCAVVRALLLSTAKEQSERLVAGRWWQRRLGDVIQRPLQGLPLLYAEVCFSPRSLPFRPQCG